MLKCKCGKGAASTFDNLCKFCREDAHCSTRRESLIYGVKHRGDGLPLEQFLKVEELEQFKREAYINN